MGKIRRTFDREKDGFDGLKGGNAVRRWKHEIFCPTKSIVLWGNKESQSKSSVHDGNRKVELERAAIEEKGKQ